MISDREKLEIAIKALKFYAEADWEERVERYGFIDPSGWDISPPEIIEDEGTTAREALKKIQQTEINEPK